MTHIGGVGRANHLVKQVAASIERAMLIQDLPEETVKYIFGDLMEDSVISGIRSKIPVHKLKRNEATDQH